MAPRGRRTGKDKVAEGELSSTQMTSNSLTTAEASSASVDYGSMTTPSLLKIISELNKDPALEPLLYVVSERVSRENFSELLEADIRSRSIIISGVEEAPEHLPPSERQRDVERKVTDLLDAVKVECRPDKVLRMGVPNPNRPRLIKVVLPSRLCWRTALANAKLLRSAGYSHVFLRKSMTAEERKRDFELRQEARERNKGKPTREWVVFRGELKRISDLPRVKNSGNY
ncbi:hypothetical protein Aduo_001580 [Ancylostoma duodenale]